MRSSDGREFYDMKAVIPEIPPYRYEGHIKNLGAQYMRGICDYNDAFDKNVWITYSCNKEDIWISKIAGITSDNIDKKYSVMSPLWGSVKRDGDSLWKVVDRDACERAIIEYFPGACENVSVKLDVKKISDDNGVMVVFYNAAGDIIKETVCRKGMCIAACSQDEMKQENVEIYRVAVYSKEKLALNTLSDDGRLGALSDMEYADRKDYYTEFCVKFISE